jgi:hypothetical protein
MNTFNDDGMVCLRELRYSQPPLRRYCHPDLTVSWMKIDPLNVVAADLHKTTPVVYPTCHWLSGNVKGFSFNSEVLVYGLRVHITSFNSLIKSEPNFSNSESLAFARNRLYLEPNLRALGRLPFGRYASSMFREFKASFRSNQFCSPQISLSLFL